MLLSTIFQLYWRKLEYRIKPPHFCNSLTNIITMLYRVHLAMIGFRTQRYALIAQVVVNQPGIESRRTLQNFEKVHELIRKRYQQLPFHVKCKIINKQFAHSMFLIFLVFCVVLCFCFVCPRHVSCVPMLPVSILDCTFVFSNIY